VRSLDALAAQLDGEHAHASKGLDALKRFLPHSPKRS
jgi:pilus assembly protein CpaE